MEIDWRVLFAGFLIVGALCFVLLRTILQKAGEIQRLKAEHKQANGELLRTRGQHAIEMAELKAEHSKVITALQGNVNDLTGLLKEHNKSQWDGWLQKQRTRFGTAITQR